MLLSAQNLRFAYPHHPEKTILHDVSLTLDAGETLFVLGRNGGGKTTLLRCLAGLLRPQSGRVLLAGQPLSAFGTGERARLIGLIPQMHSPGFAYSVGEMVLMGRAPHWGWLGTPSARDQAIAEDALEEVGIADLRRRPYTDLSGGEQQLVRIARGLAQQCQILLMDEPTAHLDLSNQHRVLEVIHQLRAKGLAFIIASHAPNDALTYADRVLLLTGGWVTACGTPADTLTEALLSAAYGIRTEIIPGENPMTNTPRAILPKRPITLLPNSLKEPDSLLSQMLTKSDQSPQLILVTGLSGAGKTTWCSRLVAAAREKGLGVEGVLSPGIFDAGQKIGLEVQNLATGESRRLADLRQGETTRLSTPRWAFHEEALDWANRALERNHHSDLLVIDELGPLEFMRGQGLTAGMARLDQGDYRLACVVVRTSLTPNALQRWPHALVVSGTTAPPA